MGFKLLLIAILGFALTYDGIRRLRLRYKGKNQKVFRNICQATAGVALLVLLIIEMAKLRAGQ